MEYMNGLEEDKKQLPTNATSFENGSFKSRALGMNRDGHLAWSDPKPSYPLTEGLLLSHVEFSDEFSVIEDEHVSSVDITKSLDIPFRWDVERVHTSTIFNMSSNFGPMCFVELNVVPESEVAYDFHIMRVYNLQKTSTGCIVPTSRDDEAEGQTIRLIQGNVFSNAHLESMATTYGSEWTWEDAPELKLYPLIQYWAFHHPEALDRLHGNEMYDA